MAPASCNASSRRPRTVERSPLFRHTIPASAARTTTRSTPCSRTSGAPHPISEDGTELSYGGEIGAQTLKTWTDGQPEDEIGEPAFVPAVSGYRDGFHAHETTGTAIVDAFAIGKVRNNDQFGWGVANLSTFDEAEQLRVGPGEARREAAALGSRIGSVVAPKRFGRFPAVHDEHADVRIRSVGASATRRRAGHFSLRPFSTRTRRGPNLSAAARTCPRG